MQLTRIVIAEPGHYPPGSPGRGRKLTENVKQGMIDSQRSSRIPDSEKDSRSRRDDRPYRIIKKIPKKIYNNL